MTDVADLRARVARACRVLARLDLTSGTQGHVSARIPGTDRILMRARGAAELGVRFTQPDDVIEVTLEGSAAGTIGAGVAVPIEVFIHTELYRARPDVMSVVHMHPRTVVLMTVCDKPLLPIFGAYDPSGLLLVTKGIPMYDKSVLIRSPELGRELAEAIGEKSVCLMRGHGITAAGDSIEEAALAAITLNELATMNYDAALLGNPRSISDEDIDSFERGNDVKSQSAAGYPSGRAASSWRYWVSVTDAD